MALQLGRPPLGGRRRRCQLLGLRAMVYRVGALHYVDSNRKHASIQTPSGVLLLGSQYLSHFCSRAEQRRQYSEDYVFTLVCVHMLHP